MGRLSQEWIDWIEKGLAKPGKSRTGLAKALGRNPSMVTLLLKGGRELKASEIGVVARYLEEGPPQVESRPEPEAVVTYVPLMGDVEAGVWREVLSDTGIFDDETYPVPVDPRWPAGSVYAFRVRGESVNRRARDGDLVICLDAHAAPRSLQDGDWVVAERRRFETVERTVKQARRGPEGWELWPDSDDPRYRAAIRLDRGGGDDESVSVRAFVLDFVRPATRF